MSRQRIGVLLAAAALAGGQGTRAAAQTATYQVTFQGNWTTASTPGGVVSGAHFTTLIGAVHGSGVTFWGSGRPASRGVENVAELGAVGTFRGEIQASPHTGSVIEQSVSGGGRGSATFTITVTRTHPRVTLLSMIGPSPDWFVGVSGLSLLDDAGQWRDEYRVDLFPYDAGTEDGTEFTLSNPPTDPQGVITSIRGTGKFSRVRMARLTFTNQTPDPEASFASGSSSAGEGAGTRNVTVNVSPAPAGGVTLGYTLSGTAALGSDYQISGASGSSGTVAVASGQTSAVVPVVITDDSAEEADETVVLTLTAGDGYRVGSPATHTLTITDDDAAEPPPPQPSVRLSVSPNPVEEGRPVTVSVSLSEALESSVTISLTLTRGTAEASDYGSLAGIAVPAGQTRGTGSIMTAQDADQDDETFTVALGALPSEVRAGSPASVTVRIADDDVDGSVPSNRPPSFGQSSYVFELPEGVAGPVELGRTEATDPDGEALRYELASGDGARFAVRAADGALSYEGEGEDFEAEPRSYGLTVLARDESGGEARATVEVRITNVNEAPVAVGSVLEQTLEAGGQPARVELAPYFEDVDGDALGFRAASSDTTVARADVAGSVLTLSPVAAGVATVTVSAEDPAGQTATQTFGVGVNRNPMERVMLEETLAAMARSHLASARTAVGRRVARTWTGGGGEVRVSGRRLPVGKSEAWAELKGAAGKWLSGWEALLPGDGAGPGGPGMLPGGRFEAPGTVAPGPVALPAWPGLADGLGVGGDSERLVGDTGFELEWGRQEAGDGGTRWGIWGEGDVQTFEGRGPGASEYDGDVRTGYVGLDAELTEHWLVGTAVSRSRGGGEWRAGTGSGRLTSTLTALHPYGRWSNGSASLWATAGGGWGEIENAAGRERPSVSGLRLRLGLIELRRRVGNAAGAEFALRADAAWAELRSEEGRGSADGLRARVRQTRVGADVARAVRAGGVVLEPFGEAHFRRDGGTGQVGSGLEVAGGVRAAAGRVRIEAQGRLLAVHSTEGYGERGASVALSVGAREGRGLSLSVASNWGDGANPTGVLWEGDGLHGRRPPTRSGAWAMDARGSYGVRVGDRFLHWFGTVSRPAEGLRFTLGGRFGNEAN